MKKRLACLGLVFLFGVAVFGFAGCWESPFQDAVAPAESNTSRQQSETFSMETLFLEETISAEYPQFQDSGYDVENAFLRRTVEEVVRVNLAGSTAETSTDLTGEVTYWDGTVLCFVLEGLWNDSSAAHPIHFWEPILMDLERQTLISLADLMPLENEFLLSFRQAYQEQIVFRLEEKLQMDLSQDADALQQWLEGYSDEAIRSDLSLTAQNPGGSFRGFFTETAVGISVSIPHALGDHVEIYLQRE